MPSWSSGALAFLSIILLCSQLTSAHEHERAEQVQSSVYAAFEALPDAVLVLDLHGQASFSKDFVPPKAPVLPLLLTEDTINCEPLRATLCQVRGTRVAEQTVLSLADSRYLECRVTPYACDELLVIARDITDVHKDSERIRYLATHDAMTGLLNRNSFHVALQQAVARANRVQRPFGLLFIDLDHFKTVNDTLGHEAGDSLLKEVTQRLTSTLRQSDSAYRFAGDEFTVLLEGLDATEDAFLVAQKVCDVLARPYFETEGAPQVSASIGVVVYPHDGATSDELISLADKAMYRAKAQGRNKAAMYTLSTSQLASQLSS